MKNKISESDSAILAEVQKHGVRSYAELRTTALKPYHRSYAWAKMKRLVNVGLLHVILDPLGGIMGWRAAHSKKALAQYPEKDAKINSLRGYKYQTSYAHDLEVRWVCDQLEKLDDVVKIDTESAIRREMFIKYQGYTRSEMKKVLSRMPDARFNMQVAGRDVSIALEIEMNLKSAARLHEKVAHYIAESGYDFVFYICGSDSIVNALLRVYGKVLENSPAVRIAIRKAKIYFCTLEMLKNDFQKAKFISINDEFTFERFKNTEPNKISQCEIQNQNL